VELRIVKRDLGPVALGVRSMLHELVLEELFLKLETGIAQTINELLTQASRSIDTTRKLMPIPENGKSSLSYRDTSDYAKLVIVRM
jgi:hypothetical protein